MSSLYKFDLSSSPISMYEWDDGIWKLETLSLNESLTLNLDGSVTLQKTYSTFSKVEIFAITPDVNDDPEFFYQVSETYTLPDGTPLTSDPQSEPDDDGIEDDQDGDGSNDDLLEGSEGDDTEHGGAGDDFVDGGIGDDDLYGDEGDDDLNGGDGNDMLVGGVGFDALSGGVGDDDLDGNEDDDLLEGGEGADNLDGGSGSDDLDGGVGDDILNGGDGDDYLVGADGLDNLLGGTGNDELYAGAGDDTVDAGAGNDLIIGGDGAGNDKYIGGSGIDTVKYTSAIAGITVNLSVGSAKSTSTDSGIGIDTLATIENIISGNFNDVLTGSSVANKIEGGLGNDTINGMAGNDALLGGEGNDILIGGVGLDALSGGAGDDSYTLDNIGDSAAELADEGIDTVQSSVSVSGLLADDAKTAYIGSYVENILLTGSTALNATGNALDNTVTGNSGANTLRGGDGNDTLIGGLGKDTLYGGIGNDTFKFNLITETKIGTARDVIADFSAGDVIDLSAIDAKLGGALNDAFTFLGTNAPTLANANGALWFKNGVLYGSTDGDIASEFEIAFTGVVSLSASDFVL